jgi:hypothetical protein
MILSGFLDSIFLDVPVKFAKVTVVTEAMLKQGVCMQLLRYDGEPEYHELFKVSFEEAQVSLQQHQSSQLREGSYPVSLMQCNSDVSPSALAVQKSRQGREDLHHISQCCRSLSDPTSCPRQSESQGSDRVLLSSTSRLPEAWSCAFEYSCCSSRVTNAPIATGLDNKYVNYQEKLYNLPRGAQLPGATPASRMLLNLVAELKKTAP